MRTPSGRAYLQRGSDGGGLGACSNLGPVYAKGMGGVAVEVDRARVLCRGGAAMGERSGVPLARGAPVTARATQRGPS
jgi:hypothetical protein